MLTRIASFERFPEQNRLSSPVNPEFQEEPADNLCRQRPGNARFAGDRFVFRAGSQEIERPNFALVQLLSRDEIGAPVETDPAAICFSRPAEARFGSHGWPLMGRPRFTAPPTL